MPDSTSRLQTLDGLRGIAALCVVLLHEGIIWQAQLMPGGYLAVDLFFVLSGFVIANAYESRFTQGMTFLAFLRARVIRFYPLYILGLAIGIVEAAFHVAAHTPHAMSAVRLLESASLSLLFIPASLGTDGTIFPLNAPAWTLFFELVVNFAYAALFRFLTDRVLIVVAAISFPVLAVAAMAHGSADLGATPETMLGGLARAVFSFSIGVLIFRKRLTLRVPALVLVGVTAALLALPMDRLRVGYDLVCIAAAFPLIVAAGHKSETGRLNRLFAYLGVTSYCIYVIHFPLLKFAMDAQKVLHLSGAVLGVLLLAGLLIVCPLLDAHYDLPLRRILSRWVAQFGRQPASNPAQ